ncbi:MAG: hypothetical protein PHT35_06595 [Bacteroidales bacterium]|nr:hypothetical protein [Bacteroidales bacterium]MDD3521859.1 hypothetical protein [Bacteroidales bacterium]MDD4031219.1 hypothetical protein [Bacteroidales bacterium]MDD4435925.1 hypothetical protein [Bacteroidales bacterium]
MLLLPVPFVATIRKGIFSFAEAFLSFGVSNLLEGNMEKQADVGYLEELALLVNELNLEVS